MPKIYRPAGRRLPSNFFAGKQWQPPQQSDAVAPPPEQPPAAEPHPAATLDANPRAAAANPEPHP